MSVARVHYVKYTMHASYESVMTLLAEVAKVCTVANATGTLKPRSLHVSKLSCAAACCGEEDTALTSDIICTMEHCGITAPGV